MPHRQESQREGREVLAHVLHGHQVGDCKGENGQREMDVEQVVDQAPEMRLLALKDLVVHVGDC